MPGGNKNISPSDGKKFSSDHQPANRKKSAKILTDMLTKELKGSKSELVIEGEDLETGEPTKVKVIAPTKEVIVQALLRKAAKGDVLALNLIFERIEGKVGPSGTEGLESIIALIQNITINT